MNTLLATFHNLHWGNHSLDISFSLYHKLYLISQSILSFPKMTRCKWTSGDQEEWLKSHIPRFSDAQVNKTTTKEIFPEILKEWREAWPCPGPTPEEIAQAGSVEKATQKKRSEENAVCQLIRC